jgi:hypothetical protein
MTYPSFPKFLPENYFCFIFVIYIYIYIFHAECDHQVTVCDHQVADDRTQRETQSCDSILG